MFQDKMEQSCIFCFEEQLSTNLVSSSKDNLFYRQQVFQVLSHRLRVDDEVAGFWDFSTDCLPFCDDCAQSANTLYELDKQLIEIELQIAQVVENYKLAVKKSATNARAKDDDDDEDRMSKRYANFRQQVLANADARYIATRRLENISDLYPIYPGPRSVMSIDELSLDQCDVDVKPFPRPLELLLKFDEDSINSNIYINEDIRDLVESNTSNKPRWSEARDGSQKQYGHVEISIEDEDVTEENGERKVASVWRCKGSQCSFNFVADEKKHPKKAMARHIELVHYPCCKLCGEKLSSVQELESHICTTYKGCKEKRSERTCRSCKVVFENWSSLRIHDCPQKGQTNKNAASFGCKYCDKSLSSKAARERHVEIVHKQKPMEQLKNQICHHCGRKYSKVELTRHLRDAHDVGTPKQQLKCPNCPKTFPNNSRLGRHLKTHLTDIKTSRTLSIDDCQQINFAVTGNS